MSSLLTRNDVAVQRVRLLTVPDRDPSYRKTSYVLELIREEQESDLEIICELSTACAVMAISSRDDELRNVAFEAESFDRGGVAELQATA